MEILNAEQAKKQSDIVRKEYGSYDYEQFIIIRKIIKKINKSIKSGFLSTIINLNNIDKLEEKLEENQIREIIEFFIQKGYVVGYYVEKNVDNDNNEEFEDFGYFEISWKNKSLADL